MIDRTTTKSFAMYSAYQAVRYVAPMVLTPFLAHALGRDQFAELVILNSCIWASTVFMEFGFYLYGISKTAAAVDRRELSLTVTAITAGKVVLIPLAMSVYLGLAAWAGLLFRDPRIVAIGAFSAIGYGGSFAWFFQGRQRAGTAVTIEAAPQLIYYAAVLSLVRRPGDLWLVALCQTIPPVISVVIGARLIIRTGLLKWPELAAVKCVMIEALPYFVERLCFTLYTAIMPTLIAALSMRAEASYYSIGDRVGTFLGTLTAPIFQAALPFVSRKMRTEGGGWRLPLAFVGGVTSIVGVVAAAAFLACDPVISRFFSRDFQPAIPVAHLFCVNAVVSVLGMALANFVIIPKNAARVMIWSSTTALAAGVIVGFVAIPRFGALGAAASRCTSELVVAIMLGGFVVRLFMSETRTRPRPAAVPLAVDL